MRPARRSRGRASARLSPIPRAARSRRLRSAASPTRTAARAARTASTSTSSRRTFAPEGVPQGEARLPVMVWIHGGGNSIGDARIYDGGYLAAEQGVIVVAVQYRMGPFGWLRHASLRADAGATRRGPVGQLRHARPDRGAALGGGQRRGVRRRPRARHRVRRVGRRAQHLHAAPVATREGAVPARDLGERRHLLAHARRGREPHHRRRARPREQLERAAAAPAREAPRRSGPRGRTRHGRFAPAGRGRRLPARALAGRAPRRLYRLLGHGHAALPADLRRTAR